MSSHSARVALGYLWYATSRNKLRAQLARVKQPRYLVAMALGLLYLGWILRLNTSSSDAPFADFTTSGVAPTVVSALLLVMSARWWLAKPDRGALAFTPAEVHLLFPGPLSRRMLVHSKLLRGQFGILLNVLIWVLLLRGGATSIDGWQRGIGLWILFSTFTLHRLAAALVRLNASQHAVAGRKRSLLPAAVFLAMFSTVGVVLWNARPELSAAMEFGVRAMLNAIYEALQHPAAAIALAPVRALVAPGFADNARDWLMAMPPALLVLALHYFWVVRTDTAFEEAALEASQERARVLEAYSGGKVSAKRSESGKVQWVFPLPNWGHRSVGLAWKNAAAAVRGGGWVKQLIAVTVLFFVFLLVFRLSVGMPFEVIVALSTGWGFMLLLIGPVWTRFDLRLDLRDVAALRALPLSSQSIVSSAIVGVAVLHTVSIVAFLAVPVLFAIADGMARAELLDLVGAPVPALLATLMAILSINLLTFSVQNGLALLFPAWVQLGTDRRGFEAMGQTMLTVGMTAVVGAIALVFPALIGVATSYITYRWLGEWTAPVAVAVGTIVLLVELIPGWIALGGVLDALEPADVPGQRT